LYGKLTKITDVYQLSVEDIAHGCGLISSTSAGVVLTTKGRETLLGRKELTGGAPAWYIFGCGFAAGSLFWGVLAHLFGGG